MIRSAALAALVALAPLAGAAQEHTAHIEDYAFSFEGPFGSYDRNQLQRGLQVFTEVCSACHGMQYVAYRTLGDTGGPELPEDQVKAYAATHDIDDAATGETRPAVPSDHFGMSQYEGAPDLSLMAKARAAFHGPYGLTVNQLFRGTGGPEYIHALLGAYTGEDKDEAGTTFYENPVFSTGWIKMPPPLSDGLVEFADGSPNDVTHMSADVAAFLMWTAEPKLDARKEAGFVAVLFLAIFAVLLYFTNKRIWEPIKRRTTRTTAPQTPR